MTDNNKMNNDNLQYILDELNILEPKLEKSLRRLKEKIDYLENLSRKGKNKSNSVLYAVVLILGKQNQKRVKKMIACKDNLIKSAAYILEKSGSFA